MPKPIAYTLLAALLSAGLFLIVFGFEFRFIFIFLPILPLLALGLSKESRLALLAAIGAAALVAVITELGTGLFFLLVLGIPAWYMVRESVRWRGDEAHREWMPIGVIITRLTLSASALVALMTLYYAPEPGGLPAILSQNMKAFVDMREDYSDFVNELATNWTFLIVSITIWLWGLAFYAYTWLVNRGLATKGQNLRPDFAVEVFPMPRWLPSFLALCALASLIGGPSMSFLGKSLLISLLLPYFFQGAALLQQASKRWPSRRFFMFFIYFMIFAQFWPALVLAGWGLWHQIKHLSESGSWFKS